MRIALLGYGKMGKMIERIAIERGHEIVSIIDVDNQDDFNSEAFKSADVAIEFTNPMVAYDNYMKTFACRIVSNTFLGPDLSTKICPALSQAFPTNGSLRRLFFIIHLKFLPMKP